MRWHELLWVAIFAFFALGVQSQAEELRVLPQRVVLDSPEASQQVLVTLVTSPRSTTDMTRRAEYEILDTHIASINDRGEIHPLSEGTTELLVRVRDERRQIPIEVRRYLD